MELDAWRQKLHHLNLAPTKPKHNLSRHTPSSGNKTASLPCPQQILHRDQRSEKGSNDQDGCDY
jgi:hypothetical protein